MERLCELCRRPLSAKRARCYFCTGRKRTGEERRCVVCGALLYVQRAELLVGGGLYCSTECKYTAMRGRERKPGGRYVTKTGYVAVKVGIRTYQLEHRLVVEAALGRSLATDEHVHHINGDKQDNRQENLRLISPDEHSALHAATNNVQAQPRRITLVCHQCGTSYERKASRLGESKYCSGSCRSRAVSLARWAKKGS